MNHWTILNLACSAFYLLWLTTEMSFIPSSRELDKLFVRYMYGFQFTFSRYIFKSFFFSSFMGNESSCLCVFWGGSLCVSTRVDNQKICYSNPCVRLTVVFFWKCSISQVVLLFWNVKIVDSSVLTLLKRVMPKISMRFKSYQVFLFFFFCYTLCFWHWCTLFTCENWFYINSLSTFLCAFNAFFFLFFSFNFILLLILVVFMFVWPFHIFCKNSMRKKCLFTNHG